MLTKNSEKGKIGSDRTQLI